MNESYQKSNVVSSGPDPAGLVLQVRPSYNRRESLNHICLRIDIRIPGTSHRFRPGDIVQITILRRGNLKKERLKERLVKEFRRGAP